MAINYSLKPLKFSNASDDHCARVSFTASAGLDAIVDQMMQQGSTVTKSDIYAVLEEAVKATEHLLMHGMRVNFGGLVQLYPKIKGTFNGPMDSFNESRHKLDVGSTPASRLRNTLRQKASVIQKETVMPEPAIVQIFDFDSNEINGLLTRGSICSVRGSRLKFDPQSADEGIYCINASDNTEVRINNVFKNMPKELVFTVPESLTAGENYYLEVRCRMIRSSQLRSCRFNSTFRIS